MQQQFLDVLSRDEAERRFRAALQMDPQRSETIALEDALGRVLAEDVVSRVDVPSFDRSNFDGFAVRATDTINAREEVPKTLRLISQEASTAVVPTQEVISGTAMAIATGGVLPRGADAIVMVEHTDVADERLLVRKAVAPGFGITFAGTDMVAGETAVRCGQLITSRETGVLAAVGAAEFSVWCRPVVAILSTGDEIISPRETMRPGLVYDSNAYILADAVRELGAEPRLMGIVRDDTGKLREMLQRALQQADVVILSGGTSKGSGDLSYHVVGELKDPGIVAHGVALKPGKPICLAADQGKPVVILPGFPTSAIFTFHEFVAPVIQSLGGQPRGSRALVDAKMAVRVNSEIGRTEYLLVGLVPRPGFEKQQDQLAAYPMGKGSGSVTTFSRADGFITIPRHREIIEADAPVKVQLLGNQTAPADLVVIGSHCVGAEMLLGQLQQTGFVTKYLAVGSTAGLEAARRGECDLAGIHLLDPETDTYNSPFLDSDLVLISGYARMQGVVHRPGDQRFEGQTAEEAIQKVRSDSSCVMVNRNQGSGTRILIDRLLDGARPEGYAVQARNHSAIAASVGQQRADWGIAIESVARQANLGFLPLARESFDFVVPSSRCDRPAVRSFQSLLQDRNIREKLGNLGLQSPEL